MVEPNMKSLPNSEKVIASLRDPAALLALGDLAADFIIANPYKYDSKKVVQDLTLTQKLVQVYC